MLTLSHALCSELNQKSSKICFFQRNPAWVCTAASEMQQEGSENICHSHYLQGLQSAHSTDWTYQHLVPEAFPFLPKEKWEISTMQMKKIYCVNTKKYL